MHKSLNSLSLVYYVAEIRSLQPNNKLSLLKTDSLCLQIDADASLNEAKKCSEQLPLYLQLFWRGITPKMGRICSTFFFLENKKQESEPTI